MKNKDHYFVAKKQMLAIQNKHICLFAREPYRYRVPYLTISGYNWE